MTLADVKFLSEDQEQLITLKWECLWNQYKSQLKHNAAMRQSYRRACHMLNQYKGPCPMLTLRRAINMAFFFDFKPPVDFDTRHGEIYWGELPSRLYQASIREQAVLHQISDSKDTIDNLNLNPLTIISVFANSQNFSSAALNFVAQKQAASKGWTPKAKNWLQKVANDAVAPSAPKQPTVSSFDFLQKMISKIKSSR